ncbi:MAG TPA: hypothetical protein VE262_07340 [Blastocatellia bacterium]|nr:hypothetical protein [Blastocatellia bacterium]
MHSTDPDLPFGVALFIILGLLGTAALYLTKQHRATLKMQVELLWVALAVRFLASVVIYEFGMVNVLGDEDASGWVGGVGFYESWTRKGFGLLDLPSLLAGAFEGHHRGYYYMLGGLFFVTDSPARLPAAALNCFFGALTVVFAYRIAQSLFSEWVAVRVGWVACFFPSLIVWSAQTVKEPVVILLETVALYGCVKLKLSGFSLKYILLCAAAILLVIPFRFYAAYIAGAAVLFSLLLPQFGKSKVSVGSAIAVLALLIPTLAMSGILVRHEAELEKFNLSRIQRFKEDVGVDQGSAVEVRYDLESPAGFAAALAIGGAHLLLAPFPWQMGGSLRMILTGPEVVVWWWLVLVGLAPGLWYALRTRFNEIQPLLIFLFGLGLLYSLMFGNIGLIYRQRAQLLPWLLIFAVVGLERRMIRRVAARRARMNPPVLAEAPR